MCIVAMATRHMNLQSVLLLDHVIRQLLYSYNTKVYQYQSTEVAINCTQNIQKCQLLFLAFSGMLFVVMATQKAMDIINLLAEKVETVYDVLFYEIVSS